MATISSIETRLQRLERKTDTGNPYAHMTDEELEARLADLTRGMFEGIGQGDQDAGYAMFRDWCEQPTPQTLEEFLGAMSRLSTGIPSKFDAPLMEFMAEHCDEEDGRHGSVS